jgi:hypothetical protein
MKKRIAKKILKNKERLNYSTQQIEKATKSLEKTKPKEQEESK